MLGTAKRCASNFFTRLGGSPDTKPWSALQDYIRSMCNMVINHLEWRAVVLNWRGFNDAPITKSKVILQTLHGLDVEWRPPRLDEIQPLTLLMPRPRTLGPRF